MSVTQRTAPRTAPLPTELTPLLGRDREAAHLRDLLDDPSIRLVTLTGPGGVGKTRLALHVAGELLDTFGDNVAYVSLAAIREPAQVLPEIVATFGRIGAPGDSPEDQLVELLGDEPFLLVLDNLEQVTAAAPDLAATLTRCPRLTILGTSQAPLGIVGEQLYPLAPLPTPGSDATGAEAILRSEAVRLFVQRARAVRPTLEVTDRTAATIAEICRQLDGLPLAIELAAARTSILSPDALLARLSNRLQLLGSQRQDVPDRQRTMRSAVAWSYDLLPAEGQTLFRRIAVFTGGCSLEAVEAIAEVLAERGCDPLELLSALVDHSLLRLAPQPDGEARYAMLETLRHFGLEQVEAVGEGETTRLAHARYFAGLTERAEGRLTGPGQAEALRTLDAESENLRAAVAWSLASGNADLALRILAATWRWAPERGMLTDYRAWFDRALASGQAAPAEVRGKALLGAGYLAEDVRDLDAARALFTEALTIARDLGDTLAESAALIGLGTADHDRGEYAEAMVHHQGALDAAEETGDQRAIAIALGNLAVVSYYQGNLDTAEGYWDRALAHIVRTGDTLLEAVTSSNLAALASERGDYARAEGLLTRTLELQREMESLRDLPFTLINLGESSRGLGDYAAAHDHLAEAVRMLRESDNAIIEGHAMNGLAALALDEGKPAEAAALLLESMRLVANAGDQLTVIDNAELLARICAAAGRHEVAVELVAAATRMREEIDSAPSPVRNRELEAIEAAAREVLPAATIEERREAGRALVGEALVRRAGIVAREIVGPRRAPIVPLAVEEALEPQRETWSLTKRETEVLRLLAQGRSTPELAEELYISPRTATTHITNILGKLGVSGRTAAVALALREGLV